MKTNRPHIRPAGLRHLRHHDEAHDFDESMRRDKRSEEYLDRMTHHNEFDGNDVDGNSGVGLLGDARDAPVKGG